MIPEVKPNSNISNPLVDNFSGLKARRLPGYLLASASSATFSFALSSFARWLTLTLDSSIWGLRVVEPNQPLLKPYATMQITPKINAIAYLLLIGGCSLVDIEYLFEF
jgi:hypothetical protein